MAAPVDLHERSGPPRAKARLQACVLLLVLFSGLFVALNLFGREVPDRWLVSAIASAAAVLCAMALGRVFLLRPWRRERLLGASRVRWLLYAFLLAAVAQFALLQPYHSKRLQAAVALGFGLFAASVLFGKSVSRRVPRLAKVADVALMNAAILLVGVELGLRLLSNIRPSEILTQPDIVARDRVGWRRLRPGSVRFGFPANGEGFYDTEFVPREKLDADRLVVSIGDSFSVGMVPHAFHFTTVCERELSGYAVLRTERAPPEAGRVEVYNMGMAGLNPREYLYLVEKRALALGPDAIVVNLFLGNDLTTRTQRRTRYWFDRENLLLVQVPRRLLKLSEAKRHMEQVWNPFVETSEQEILTVAQSLEKFPWLEDPTREPPSYSEEEFLQIECANASAILGKEAREYRDSLGYVERMKDAAGAAPLLVVLIPDEFQVEDALWDEVAARLGNPDRDSPQRVLGEWLREKGIAYLDLLPDLRAVSPLADGKRHLYHAKDTHFNLRGNQVAGKALARALRELLLP